MIQDTMNAQTQHNALHYALPPPPATRQGTSSNPSQKLDFSPQYFKIYKYQTIAVFSASWFF